MAIGFLFFVRLAKSIDVAKASLSKTIPLCMYVVFLLLFVTHSWKLHTNVGRETCHLMRHVTYGSDHSEQNDLVNSNWCSLSDLKCNKHVLWQRVTATPLSVLFCIDCLQYENTTVLKALDLASYIVLFVLALYNVSWLQHWPQVSGWVS